MQNKNTVYAPPPKTTFFVCKSARLAVTIKHCLTHKDATAREGATTSPCRDCNPEQKLAATNRFTLEELFHGKGFDEYKSVIRNRVISNNKAIEA